MRSTPWYELLVARTNTLAVCCVSLVGCGGQPVPPRNEVDLLAPSVTASVSAASESAAPSASAVAQEQPGDPCATAFEDQLMLYIDVEVRERGVHPGWRALFLEHCQKMPPAFQRCASPLYQTGHEAECNAVKSESGTPAKREWLATFDVLHGRESLSQPPPPR